MTTNRLALLTLLPIFLVLSACYSLAEDITPPPGYESTASQPPTLPPTSEATFYPLVSPDPVAGKAIFSEKCLPCHGENGLGDGPQAGSLPNPVAPIGDPSRARQAIPAEWFGIVTTGNIEKYMPPFANLSERQRWDVLAYVFTLGTPPDVVEQGQTLYQADCADCHGETGQGDGPRAISLVSSPQDFTDQARMSELSAGDLYKRMLHPDLPAAAALADRLSEEDRWALAGYLRSLTFASPGGETVAEPAESGSAETGQPTDATGAESLSVGTVVGQVTNASGGALPDGLEVILHGYDHINEVYSSTLKIGPDGAFKFENVEMPLDRAFIVSVGYGDNTFASDLGVVEPGVESLSLPVDVYDSSTDVSALTVDRVHLFLDFAAPDVLRVAELFIISNPTNQVIVAPEEGGPVVRFSLPEGAANLQIQDGVLGGRYVKTADGFGDTRGVVPGGGNYQVLFSFDMSYKRKLELSHPLNLPVTAMIVMVPEGSVKIKADMLETQGVREVQGARYEIYSGNQLPAGSQLSMTISGRPGKDSAGLFSTATGSDLLIGLGALGLALLVTGVWMYRHQRKTSPEDEEPEDLEELENQVPPSESQDPSALMDAIIALDDLYKEGELPKEAYLKRRADLKEQLSDALEAAED